MSSTIKRVALVAVAALGLGTLTAVSSSAVNVADSFTSAAGTATASSTGTAGTAVTTETVLSGIGAATDTLTVSGTVVSSPLTSAATAVTFAQSATTASVNAVVTHNGVAPATSGLVATSTNQIGGRYTGYITASFTPDVAGTYVIKMTSAGGPNLQSVTWTITVAAVPVVTAANSTSVIQAAGSTGTFTADETVAAAKDLAALSGVSAANIKVVVNNSVPTNLTASTPLTVYVSGPGLISITNAAVAANAAAPLTVSRAATATINAAAAYVNVYSDGNAGKSTISIYAGTTLLATETLDFYGAVASLTASVTSNLNGDLVAAGNQAGVYVVAKDANGIVVPGSAVTATSSNTAIVTAAAGTTATAAQVAAGAGANPGFQTAVVGGKYGTVKLTITSSVVTTVSTTVDVVVSSATAASVAMSFDKDSYVPGELVTLTVTAKDANGLQVVDGTPVASLWSSAPVANSLLAGVANPIFGIATLSKGSATATFYAPLTGGTVTVSAKDATAATAAVVASATVANANSDAIDAANEATDAANAATDAANAAAEAADAATAAAQDAQAAVAELATKVASLIAGIKAQITTLTNLVIKIQKKVRA